MFFGAGAAFIGNILLIPIPLLPLIVLLIIFSSSKDILNILITTGRVIALENIITLYVTTWFASDTIKITNWIWVGLITVLILYILYSSWAKDLENKITIDLNRYKFFLLIAGTLSVITATYLLSTGFAWITQ
jgi:hypothetical protein